jgi:hypothetical protein
MTVADLDTLEQRLSDLALDIPDPGRVSARVLARGIKPSRPRIPRILALAVATVVLVTGVLYFVPAAGVALADAPIAGPLLRDAGLVGAGDRVTSVGASATSSGYRLELVGAYADSTRTVLLVHSEPAMLIMGVGQAELRDQFGRTYPLGSAVMNGVTGTLAMEYGPLAWPDTFTGARITLFLNEITPVACVAAPSVEYVCTQGTPVAGSWTLRATVGIDGTTNLALPAPARLGAATFRFTSVRSSAATIAIDIGVTGATSDDLNARIPNGGKGTEVFTIELLSPSGEVVTASYQLVDDQDGVHIVFLGYRLSGGPYHLHISYRGIDSDRTLMVP